MTAPLATTLEHADLKMTVGALLMLALMAGVVVYALMSVLIWNQWVALGFAALAFWLPFPIVRFKAQLRIRKFEEQFPDAIDLMSRALRAGHAFTVALQMVADEAPPPVGPEFKKLYDAQNFGMPLPEALREFAKKIPLLDAKFFVTAVLTQRESGGNLSEVLDNLAGVIRERFKVKRQIRVISAHGRMTAAVLIGLPPFLALAMLLINPGHMSILTTDPMGPMLIIAAIVLQVSGTLIIKKLINIEY
jgi:tight adherence protein B